MDPQKQRAMIQALLASVPRSPPMFRPRTDSDFGDAPRFTGPGYGQGKIDPYSAVMTYGTSPSVAFDNYAGQLIGINDPRPTAGAAADDMSDKALSNYGYAYPSKVGNSR